VPPRARPGPDPRDAGALGGDSGAHVRLAGLLLTGGLVNGFLGNWWGQGWIWFALGLFVAMAATLVGLAVPYYRRVRACLEMRDIADSERDRLLRSPVPVAILLVGGVGLLTILWLMIYKPS
jgi:uncharacterized membrane protein